MSTINRKVEEEYYKFEDDQILKSMIKDIRISKLKKAQFMHRMLEGDMLPETYVNHWKTKSGLVPILTNETGFKICQEDVEINIPNVKRKL